MDTRLTITQRKALQIIRDDPGVRPREFARAMWPDSPGWKRFVQCGPKGSHQGGGMYRAGGAYMGKLARLADPPLIARTYSGRFDTGYRLTTAGYKALRED